MLLNRQRADHGDAIRLARRALPVPRSAVAMVDSPPHATSASAASSVACGHVIEILNEQRIALARRKHADRLGRHRPLRQPLHAGAKTVGPAKHQMVRAGLRQQCLDRRAPPRHFGCGKSRIFLIDNALEMMRINRPW